MGFKWFMTVRYNKKDTQLTRSCNSVLSCSGMIRFARRVSQGLGLLTGKLASFEASMVSFLAFVGLLNQVCDASQVGKKVKVPTYFLEHKMNALNLCLA